VKYEYNNDGGAVSEVGGHLNFNKAEKFRTEQNNGMWDLVKGVGSAFKAQKVNTDSTIFRLHYQVTFCIILIFTIILAANQYVGKPIRCIHHMDEKPDEVLDTFCWIHSTYTVTDAFYRKVGVEVPFPGVDNTRGNKEVKVYRFYQWVSLCLLFQVSANTCYKALDTVRPLYRTTAPLTSRCCILYIYSTNINNKFFKTRCISPSFLFKMLCIL
jgi:hypothetical protein